MRIIHYHSHFAGYAGLCLLLLIHGLVSCGCNKGSEGDIPAPNPPGATHSDITQWLTHPDGHAYFKKQAAVLNFSSGNGSGQVIEVDTTQSYQTIDGFGFTLTGGSAQLIHALPGPQKDALLNELFLSDSTHIGVSYLRVSIGASDLNANPFSYNDIPVNESDFMLKQFSIAPDEGELIPVLKEIIRRFPQMKILGSPWSAPPWMKSNKSFIGGSLRKECYDVYARYFVAYVQAMKTHGITIDAITVQNEPLHGGNNPSMVMQPEEQADFVGNHLGPAFAAAGLSTKIIIYDHNADRIDYPLAVLNNANAAKYIDGSAFHLYGGSINSLTDVHNARPDKHLYFTEQWVGGPGHFPTDLKWHVDNLVIGATRNWCRNVLEWNLASDPNYQPHTPGGCTSCLGAITIGNNVVRNVAYYIIAHASKFARPGSVRIASTHAGALHSVAFKNPAGQKVLIVLNTSDFVETFSIRFHNRHATTSLPGGAVATYIW